MAKYYEVLLLVFCGSRINRVAVFDWSISFQLSISGSLDSLDVDDLRTHTTYSSGYHRVSSIKPFFLYMYFCFFSFLRNCFAYCVR